jgi:hypothetical protein
MSGMAACSAIMRMGRKDVAHKKSGPEAALDFSVAMVEGSGSKAQSCSIMAAAPETVASPGLSSMLRLLTTPSSTSME